MGTTKPGREDLKVVGVVTARLSSRRLPGKVLLPLLGRPMLSHTIDRLLAVKRLDAVVIATSVDRSDDPIAMFAQGLGVSCWRGDLHNVLGRVRGAAIAYNADAVVRISGDSPLIDKAIVQTAIELFLEEAAELVTNVFPRSYPKGQSVEIISRGALERLHLEANRPEDREHVTRYAYQFPDRFKIRNFSCLHPRPDLQLSVDTPEDFRRAEQLIAACPNGVDFPSARQLIELADAMTSVS